LKHARYADPSDITPSQNVALGDKNMECLMKKIENVLAWRRLVRGAMVMAVGPMLLFPAGYLVPASAADATSEGPAKPIGADETIRPFQIRVPQSQLDDLRKRIAETRWPDKETVSDASQGIQLSRVQDLVRYWGTDYDWRKAEAQLNALPEFITTIDGVDIQFIHVRSRHPNALPVILTHGWPG
jgi:hypothetical protein